MIKIILYGPAISHQFDTGLAVSGDLPEPSACTQCFPCPVYRIKDEGLHVIPVLAIGSGGGK